MDLARVSGLMTEEFVKLEGVIDSGHVDNVCMFRDEKISIIADITRGSMRFHLNIHKRIRVASPSCFLGTPCTPRQK